MNQTEPNGCLSQQIACRHKLDGVCQIASNLAGCDVFPTKEECEYCARLKEPKTENMLTLAIARRCTVTKEVADKLFFKMKEIANEEAKLKKGGVGTELKKLISWFYSPNKRKCKCATRIEKMNKWGPDKCEQRIETIVRWLRHSARIAGIPFSRRIAESMIRKAIRKSREAR
jgi:hypothetical protein